MTFTKVNKTLHDNNEIANISWNQLLKDTKAKLAECKLVSAKLRAAIKYFKRQIHAGEPFPVGNKSARD